MEDDVIVEFVINQLEAEKNPDARKIQINLTGFLNGKNARIFTGELWEMLISAQSNAAGIPASMVEAKKEEILKRQEDRDRISETIKRTVSRFTDKLRPEGDSSPPNRRSNSHERERDSSKRPGKYPDVGDKGKSKDDSRNTQSKRNYRSRRSASASPDRDKRASRSRSNSNSRDRRERERDKDRRSTAARGTRDNSRDRTRGGRRGMGRTRDNRDRLTQRRSRSRSRSPQGRLRSRSRSPYRGGGGRSRSPSPRA